MSSLFDVPAQLAMVLTLAASSAGPSGPDTRLVHEPVASVSLEVIDPERARGPFRFSEANWFRALKEDAASAAAADAKGSIFCTSSGRYYVPAERERQRLLQRRWDVALARRAARAFAERNAQRLGAALQRAPSAGDLYIAHVLGPENAITFIERAEAEPSAIAGKRLPELARAAPSLVAEQGRPLTLAQAYRRLIEPLASVPRGAGLVAAPAEPDAKPTLAQVAQRAREALAPEGAAGETANGWWPDVAAAGTPVQPQ